MTGARRAELLALITLTGFLLSVGVFYWMAYYEVRPYPYNTFLFHADDRFTAGAPGVGVHFFGDLYGMWRHTRDGSPYLKPSIFYRSNYLPFAHLLFKPLSWLSYPIAAGVFLTGATLLTLGVTWRRVATPDPIARTLLTLVIVLCAYPMVFALDRGNIDVAIFLIMWGGLWGLLSGRLTVAAVAFAAAGAIKGTPLLLVLLFVPLRAWRPAVIALVLAALFTLLGLLIMSGGVVDNFNGLRHALEDFNGAATQGTQGLQHTSTITSALDALGGRWPGLDGLGHAASPLSLVVGVLCAAGASFLPLMLWERVALLVVAIVVVPAVTYDYRLVFLLLPIYLLLSERDTPHAPVWALVLLGLLMVPKSWPVLFADVGIGAVLNPLLMLALAGGILGCGVRRTR